MIKFKYSVFFFVLFFFQAAHAQQHEDSLYIRNYYEKIERYIPMRDGVKLFTSIYIPKDKSKKYPFLINRTPYTVAPYGESEYKPSLGPDPLFIREGYIFVYQDVRGKWMSEGTFEDIRPHIGNKNNNKQVDESSDTYDTIDWLLKNIDNNNGKAGIYGISYPGFYSTAALPDAHPALKAVSPQAPVTDWFRGDDFHHNGAFFLADAFNFYSGFGVPRPSPVTPDNTPKKIAFTMNDNYGFFMELGAIKHAKERYFGDSIKFWNALMEHGVLDTFWKAREITRHLKNIKPAVMVVGGFFDAEDTYGALRTYRAIEEQNPKGTNHLVMGPWFHGAWVRSNGSSFGDIVFGQETSTWYQTNMELPFFNHYLKGKGTFDPAEATIFITGSNEWKAFDAWPPKDTERKRLYLHAKGKLSFEKPTEVDSYDEYISDPNNPVPYQQGVHGSRSREYMIDDQRFAAKRPDVMVYQTEVLTEDVTLTGELSAKLKVSTSGTDADYVVKLIDVYPDDAETPEAGEKEKDVIMGGYQMLVRGEVLRGKFRNSFETPEPFVSGEITDVQYALPDVAHTFKKGHRIMIQIQHSWFPLVDRNPQQFIDIYRQAEDDDFQKATNRLYHDKINASHIEIEVL
ncbi:CocE/NonD family hydrolase [Olivibacter sp. SDN3]|uniref:CocE/NonD family hydrolase n=1 Tax=Olivibacter sp. SDN3 TaxID=2764720 RepID=UPI00351BD148